MTKAEIVVAIMSGKIVCPHCGYDGTTPMEQQDLHDWQAQHAPEAKCIGFYLLEDVTVYRRVTAVKDGKLVVDGWYQTGEGYDDGTPGTMRVECRKCFNAFPIPQHLEVEWD